MITSEEARRIIATAQGLGLGIEEVDACAAPTC